MLDSMRSQLTLWYTGVLALVLIIFAVATYTYLGRAARQRTDQSLADTASSLVSNLNAESNDEELSGDDAAVEITRGFNFNDRQAIVFDEGGRVVAVSTAPVSRIGKSGWPSATELAPNFVPLIGSSKSAGRAYTTIHDRGEDIRALAMPVRVGDKSYTVVIAQSLHEEYEALAQVRRAFLIAIPIALGLACLGGYFLARKSLAPVVEMGDRAARIGASNLNERLPVSNKRNEVGRLAQIFNELLTRLDVSFEQQRRFMADASHELRTPVAIVCGESEVALSQAVRSTDEYRESLAIMHDEGRRLTRIVEDLFMLARADAGQFQMESSTFYVDETVGECVRAVRSLAAQHGLELRYQHAEEELIFRGDEGLIRRMVLNLLDNAIKYTPAGGRIRVEIGRAGSNYRIAVTDSGAGIPAEAQAHIFERFYRVDKARSRNGDRAGSGAGLGLSIAAWIAETHNGEVGLEASDAKGSTFVVVLPAASGIRPD
ncbi:MAG: hypothetical protein QOJ64_3229 [Acidobacteriota bacterium]|jgi:heavy metal sensor kinase|nr:hypothetical protein [Acidobacteriota bacterium]